jgi:hypothetical protein
MMSTAKCCDREVGCVMSPPQLSNVQAATPWVLHVTSILYSSHAVQQCGTVQYGSYAVQYVSQPKRVILCIFYVHYMPYYMFIICIFYVYHMPYYMFIICIFYVYHMPYYMFIICLLYEYYMRIHDCAVWAVIINILQTYYKHIIRHMICL